MAQRKQKVQVEIEHDGDNVYHRVQDLPELNDLNAKVKKIIAESSYWERHGKGLVENGIGVPLHLVGLYMCSSDSPVTFIAGFLLLGCVHSVITNKVGHLAAHNGFCESKSTNRFIRWFAIEFLGFFSDKAATQIHIGEHHPYTNIISLGDSASWKAPMLPRYIYMFIAPHLIPILAPLVSLKELKGQVWETAKFLFWVGLGMTFNIWLCMAVAGYTTVLNAAIFMFSFRAVTMLSYIHINIFQHIGLPMYALKSRPRKLYQMSTGVLNLDSNFAHDWLFGHTLFYCHIEHHLFPSLSDNMVLKIRPLVKQFMLDHDLPYHERPYMERFWHFVDKYDELMVKAPPFTHFVGLQ